MSVRKGIHHVAINVRNMDETIRFYTEALGCELLRTWPVVNPTAAMLDAGGAVLEIFACEEPYADGGKDRIPHLALVSDDVDGDFKNAVEHGAVPVTEPKDVVIESEIPVPIRIAFFKGPSGELIELFHEKGNEA